MVRQRRTRYRAEVERPGLGIESLDILAYSPAQARNLAAAHGYSVRTLAVARAKPPAERVQSWAFDMDAIRAARGAMGIYLPHGLSFEVCWRTVRANGRIVFFCSDNRAVIRVAGGLDARQADRTLWHELAHAAQYAREGGTWAAWERMKARDYGIGYHNKSMEREAREWETLAETDTLVRAL